MNPFIMKTKYKTTLSLVCIYMLFFIVGYNFSLSDEASIPDTKNTVTQRPSIKNSERWTTPKNNARAFNISHFYYKLSQKNNVASLNELFDDVFNHEKHTSNISASERTALIQKCGEIMPVQTLEKLSQISDGDLYMGVLFLGWSSQNPDAALHYYNEHLKNKVAYADAIFDCIIQGYAMTHPKLAWEKLMASEKELSPYQFQEIKKGYQETIINNHPNLIPELIAQTDFTDEDEIHTWKGNIYSAGLNWGKFDNSSRDWIASIPDPEIRNTADAMRILAITKGDLARMDEYLKTFPAEDSQQMRDVLVDFSYFYHVDKVKCIDWTFNFYSEENIPRGMDGIFMRWVEVDKKTSSQWIESLPEGSKKETLLKWQKRNDRPVL